MKINKRSHELAMRVLLILAALFAATAFTQQARASIIDKLEWKTEKYFGNTTREQLREEYGFIENPLLTSWLNEMGIGLSKVSHRADIPYEFNIVDTSEVNAFAAPGGYVFVTRGMLDRIDDDDELANVLGHEIGHVAARHGAKNIKKLPFIIAGMNILYAKGETVGRIGGMALSLLQLHYSREDEYQADKLGVEYSDKAGYDPGAMTTFFNKLESKDRAGELSKLEVSLMSHPKTTNRIATINAYPQLSETAARYISTGDRYVQRFLYHEAIAQYEKALTLDPASTPAMNGIGISNMELGNNEIARKYFNDTLKIAPADPAALENLAKLDAPAEAPQQLVLAAPEAAEAAKNDLADAVMTLQGHLDILLRSKDKAREQTLALNNGFDRRLDSFSNTAQRISERDTLRLEVLQGSAVIFGSVFSSLSELESSAEDMVVLAQDSLRRGRIALFRLERGPVTSDMAKRASGLAATIKGYDDALPEINRDINNTLADAEYLFNSTVRTMNDLSDTLNESDENILALRTRTMMDSINESGHKVVELQNAAEKTRDSIDNCNTNVRRASINLSTLALSPSEERVYKKMFSRRFRTDDGTIGAMAALGLGYGDMLALRARAAKENTEPALLIERFEKSKKTLDEFLSTGKIDSDTRDRSLDVLFALAEMDLRSLTREKLVVDLTAPEDLGKDMKITAAETESVEADPDLTAAMQSIKAGDAVKAADIVHARGKSKPATATAHKILGISYKMQGAYDEALEEFKSAARKAPNDAQAHFLAANAFLELERYEDAINEYNSALKAAPDTGAANLGLGFANVMLGNAQEAEVSLLDAIKNGADPAVAHRNIALFYYAQGRYYEAISHFDESLKADPSQKDLEKIAAKLR